MKENGVSGKAEKREKVKKTERFQGSACDNILYETKVMGLKYMKDHNTVVFLDVFYEIRKEGAVPEMNWQNECEWKLNDLQNRVREEMEEISTNLGGNMEKAYREVRKKQLKMIKEIKDDIRTVYQ